MTINHRQALLLLNDSDIIDVSGKEPTLLELEQWRMSLLDTVRSREVRSYILCSLEINEMFFNLIKEQIEEAELNFPIENKVLAGKMPNIDELDQFRIGVIRDRVRAGEISKYISCNYNVYQLYMKLFESDKWLYSNNHLFI